MPYNYYMLLAKPDKILPFSKRQNQPKTNKTSTSHVFDANNTSVRYYVYHIRPYYLNAIEE